MARLRRGWRWTRQKATSPPELKGMWALREQFVEWMQTRNYSSETIRCEKNDLARFLEWCDERSLSEPTEVTQPVVEQYQRWLFYHRRPDGTPLSFRSQHHLLCSVSQFFKYLTREHLTLFNPAAEIELPRIGRRLPRDILTASEADAVISQPNVQDLLGIRDRAILETFYSTGIRRRELANLTLYDLDTARGSLMIREGKNLKDRFVPIGTRAHEWIEKYVADVRPAIVMEPDDHYLFLTTDGKPFTRLALLSEMVRKYMRQAAVDKKGGCHVFRHTMATLMLENGADIRFIQEMLGHSRLSTTDIYTHVSIAKLQQIHQATHPAERPRPAADGAAPATSPDLLALLDADDDAGDEA
jgi:integrase/recombinase XerD